MIRDCKSRRCLIWNTILERVQTYVDPRAHIVGGELRYSLKQRQYDSSAVRFKEVWVRRVLRNTQVVTMFNELYPEEK